MPVRDLVELLSDEDIKKLEGFERLWVGFSGGLDSTVLLHALTQQKPLASKIQAVHVNHGISPNADIWAAKAQAFCAQLQIPLTIQKITLKAAQNLEEEARIARFNVFRTKLQEKDALLLAHHRDDQAETLLLQLFRGAGVDGLSGMQRTKTFAGATIFRPLLHASRKQLEAYSHHHQLTFVTDESNADCSYARNFLRNTVIPELEKKWPGVKTNLVRTAMHCQNAQTLLTDLAEMDYTEGLEKQEGAYSILNIEEIKHHSFLRMTNILRAWLRSNIKRMPSTAVFNRLLTEVIFAKEDRCPEIVWSQYCIRRYSQKLYLSKAANFEEQNLLDIPWPSFPESLELPNRLGSLEILPANAGDLNLVIPSQSIFKVAFRKGGEVFPLRGQKKSLKKLFQEWQVPPWLRGSIPLLYINDELAAVIGFAISGRFYSNGGGVHICHVELEERVSS